MPFDAPQARTLVYAVLYGVDDETDGPCHWQVWSPVEGEIMCYLTQAEAQAAALRFSQTPGLAAAVSHN